MEATDGCEGNEEILCRGSDCNDLSFLFRMSNDVMVSVLSYLCIESICHIDIAVSNRAERIIWLAGLSVNYLVTLSEYKQCKESIRWLVKRDIRLEGLQFKDSLSETKGVNDSTLLGLHTSSLRYINLRRCSIGDELVLLIADGCPHLVEIFLSNCDGVTDVSLIALGKSCLKLISIDIGGCGNITDKGLQGFADCHQNITVTNHRKSLDTSHEEHMSTNVGNEVEYTRAHGYSILSNINFSDCKKISDIGISAIANSCPLLKNIDFCKCYQITDMGLSALAHRCPLLVNIKFSDCNKISDIGISLLAHKCPLLRHIHLSACRKITDMGISAIAHRCPHLRNIDLYDCYQITDMGISALADG